MGFSVEWEGLVKAWKAGRLRQQGGGAGNSQEKPAEEPVEEFVTGEILAGSRTVKDPAVKMWQFDQPRRRGEQQ